MGQERSPSAAPVLRLVVGDGTKAAAPKAAWPKPALDDHELLAAVQRGDRGAATSLYRRVWPRIEATLGRLLGRAHPEFDDVGQLAMINLVKSVPRFRGECSLDTWVARVTAHVAFNEMRRRRSEKRTRDHAQAMAEVSGQTPSGEGGPQRRVDARGVLEGVRRHLDAMDTVKAHTVVLHDVCGYDLREIAEITGASVAAAQARLVRGRAELHERIEADGRLTEQLRAFRGGREEGEGGA